MEMSHELTSHVQNHGQQNCLGSLPSNKRFKKPHSSEAAAIACLQEAAQQRCRCHRKRVPKRPHSSEAVAIEPYSSEVAAIESSSPRSRTYSSDAAAIESVSPRSRTAVKPLPSKARLQEAVQQRSCCHRKLVSKTPHSSEAAATQSESQINEAAAKPLPSKACLQEVAQQRSRCHRLCTIWIGADSKFPDVFQLWTWKCSTN
jgi:hypothetical protein